MARVDVFLTVWGEHFVNKFLEYSLVSQLSPGNIPAAAREADLYFHIYTDRASEPYFYPAIAALKSEAEVEFLFFEDILYREGTLANAVQNSDPATIKHNVQRITSHDLIEKSDLNNASALVLLDSDFIFSEGSWAAMIERFQGGAKAICAMFMRLAEEGARGRLEDALPGGIQARELVKIGLQAMHPIAERMFIDAEPFSIYPSQINWRAGEHGFISHCYFPHPLLVAPKRGGGGYSSTMDYEYALRAVSNDNDIYLCPNSDELLICKMSPGAYLSDLEVGSPPSISQIAQFAINNTNRRHHLFFSQPVRYVAGGDDAMWASVEADAQKFIGAVDSAIELMLAGAAPGDARNLVRLKSYLGPIEDFMSPQTQSRLSGILPR
ncbi:MAG: hypothetical protein HQ503_15020 [Rhodospirillales bacterium]|nr:hypothetical protein [Rhodospirillales bacterium]